MKAWISKYALSKGVFTVDVEPTSEGGVSYKPLDGGARQYFFGSDWHQTREQAVAKAEDMRRRKLESLKKQMGKLTELKFD